MFLLLPAFFFSQLKPEIIWPLDSPRVITGNFGELRPNHFHTGLDFSTNGKENLQIYAIEEGYVSRIRVSAGGYGKVVYITHSNQKTSVYAHLNSFSLKIDRVLKAEQYAKQSYEVDFYPKPYSVFVNKNEIIGLSGNTGSSTGPHLHFELREEKSEVPLNPLNFYHIHDQTAPVLEQIAVYSVEDTLNPHFMKSLFAGSFEKHRDTVEAGSSHIAIAYAGYDQFTEDGNHNNVYSVKLSLDRELIYSHALNEMDFRDIRYVNEFCENREGFKFQKCFLPGVYPAYCYSSVKNKGRIELMDHKAHELELILTDESGNSFTSRFFIRSAKLSSFCELQRKGDCFVNCSKDTMVELQGIVYCFPSGSFFNSFFLETENHLNDKGLLQIGPEQINFRTPVQLSFPVPVGLRKEAEKLILKSEDVIYVPTVRNDSLVFAVKNFGRFNLMFDIEEPTARTNLSMKKINRLTSAPMLSFWLNDNLSGISKYSLYINNTWLPAEYDSKSRQLSYRFDQDSPVGLLELRLELIDRSGNRAVNTYRISR